MTRQKLRVLGVHGIGNYRYYRDTNSSPWAAAAGMSQDWHAWLTASLPAGYPTETNIGYYAHHLHRGTPQGAPDDPDSLEPAAQEMLTAWVESLHPAAHIELGPRTVRARQAADWLTRHAGQGAQLFALAFCREVATYLARPDPARRHASRHAVADAIAHHRPHAIVAHSLGSVVTYETLWAYPALRVDLLLTIGSPLAMPGVVFERLEPTMPGGRGQRPPNVRQWINLADIGDLVALPRDGLSPYFNGVRRDHQITIGTWDFHSAEGYLRCPDVSRALLQSPGCAGGDR